MNYMQQPMDNPEDILDPTTAMNMELVLIAKAFREYARQNVGNQIRYNAGLNAGVQIRQNARNPMGYNAWQNAKNQIGKNAGQNHAARAENNGIQLQVEEASTSGTHADKEPVLDLDGVAEEFLKEVAKFVREYKSLAKEADESLEEIKVLEQEYECILRAVVSQDMMSIMQNYSVLDTSNLQTDLERTKEKLKHV
ncbi:hypothetical protein Tco_0553721 [Tanacetum coccineum]